MTFRDKRNIWERNLSTDERSKQEGCAANLERHVFEELFLVIMIGGTIGHFTKKPNPM